MTVRLLAAGALLSGLAAAPAAAASFAFASVDLEVSLLSANPNLFVTLFEDRALDGSDAVTFDAGTGIADAFDSGFSTPGAEWVAGFTLLSTTGNVEGIAFSQYLGSGGFLVENLGSSDEEVTFFFSWDFDVETDTDTAFDFATASVLLNILADPSPADFDGLDIDLTLASSVSNGAESGSGGFEYTFTIPAFDTLAIEMLASGSATAENIAPIPLPAAGWMLLAGLGALAAMRRRA